MNKNFNGRVQQKHDTEAHWIQAGAAANPFVPLLGEVIIYDPDASHNYPRIKIGDGTTNVTALPFIVDVSQYLLKTGGTLTGRLTTTKAINQIVTGSGEAGRDAGESANPRYFPAKWTYNTNLTATNGDIFTIQIPCAGITYGVYVSIDNGANYYPVVLTGTTRLITQFTNGTDIQIVFESASSAASIYDVNGGNSAITVTGGAWRVLNYYDSNSDTKVQQLAAITTNADYPVILGYSTSTASVTNTVNKTSTLKYNPNTKALTTGGTVNGYTLAGASAKAVDTTIAAGSTSTNLPTSAAVAAFVEGKGYKTTDNDTKNTAGSTDTSDKLFLVGAKSQAANPQTYSQDTAYVGTDGCLYSDSEKVMTEADVWILDCASEDEEAEEAMNS